VIRTFRVFIFIIVGCVLVIAGCGKTVFTDHQAVAGDKLYIPQGYTKQLSKMKLSEIASFPYFHEPFICVTIDKNDQQYAVIFHSADKFDTVKLPVTYENIINQIELKGFKIKVGKTSLQNLHLFEINNSLFWNFDDGAGKVWFTLKGEVITDPFKSNQV
jgi:hypothetical protein